MVILTSGLHYKNSSKSNQKFFLHDNRVPYLHSQFHNRKALSNDKFDREVDMIKKLSKIQLGPTLYASWKNKSDYPMHYGFIVMEYFEDTVKGVLSNRDLTDLEMERIKVAIHKLHQHGICHGDLRPSNIGVNFGSEGFIEEVRFLDLAKVEQTHNHKRIKRDQNTFAKYIQEDIMARILPDPIWSTVESESSHLHDSTRLNSESIKVGKAIKDNPIKYHIKHRTPDQQVDITPPIYQPTQTYQPTQIQLTQPTFVQTYTVTQSKPIYTQYYPIQERKGIIRL